ncbi:MAG: biotin/lipoyl-binding protein [Saprospiraceae bacterium]|nr:biotin/lipoyl-binding protein [Saprospiraceae bacterium]
MIQKENPFQVVVNDGVYQFNLGKSDIEAIDFDIHKSHQKILIGNKYYDVEIVEESSKVYKITLDGLTYKVNIVDKYDQLANSLGLKSNVEKKQNNIKSPMPGLVIDVLVKEGDTVQKGEPLIILEAMKMENILKAATEVKIKKVLVEKGKAVEKNTTLIEFE